MHAPILDNPVNFLTAGELQAEIQKALDNKNTGRIQVGFKTGKTFTLFMQDGYVRQIYVRNHRIPDQNWQSVLSRYGGGGFELRLTPARALMLMKIVLEELNPAKSQTARTDQLKIMFDLAESNPFPTLFHVHWASAEAFVLIAGRNIQVRHAVFLPQTGMLDESAALKQISAWNEPQCQVKVYRGDIKNQAWLEIHLNILFEWYGQKILSYYGQLTGTVMVQAMLHNLAMLAKRRGWNLSIENHQLRDTSLFSTAAEAGAAYREIFSTIQAGIEPIIGSSLTRTLMKQAIAATRDIYKTVQEVFELIRDEA